MWLGLVVAWGVLGWGVVRVGGVGRVWWELVRDRVDIRWVGVAMG